VAVVAAQDVLFGVGGGEHDDRDAPQVRVGLDLGQDLQPGAPGQVEDEQDEVGPGATALPPGAAQVVQGLDAVAGDVQPPVDVALMERLTGDDDVALVVLDEEDLHAADAVSHHAPVPPGCCRS
jgi:hypothetical protein